MPKCDDCKWWMSFKRDCILGRKPDKCTTQSARRGDDELVARMVDMPPTDFQKVRRMFRRQGDRVVNIKKNPDWE